MEILLDVRHRQSIGQHFDSLLMETQLTTGFGCCEPYPGFGIGKGLLQGQLCWLGLLSQRGQPRGGPVAHRRIAVGKCSLKLVDMLDALSDHFGNLENVLYRIDSFIGSYFRWYAYLSPVRFDAELAGIMAEAGCAGIDFTGDSASESMLGIYRQEHTREDLTEAVKLCRTNDIAVMIDLLLGGPGETKETVKETIEFIKKINPDCAGSALGIRIYPGTHMETIVARELQVGKEVNIRRKYSGNIDLFQPTFYISEALGENPAHLVRDLIGGDERFFEPELESKFQTTEGIDSGYNYNRNKPLEEAIEKGARGAYWDILRHLRKGE